MTLTLTQSLTAVAINITSSFLANGGTSPYTYSVVGGGAGGSINSSGIYTAPATYPLTPATQYDTVQVMDSASNVATAQILVGQPILLLMDIIQSQMGLANGRVYFFDQKLMQPTDNDLYIAVSVASCKPFGNVNRSTGANQAQYVSMLARIDIDLISRSTAAVMQKENLVMALNSVYSQQQQEANSFYIANLPVGFINLSNPDGAAIPYRYTISFNMQYAVSLTQAQPYFSTFTTPTVYANS